MNKGLGEGRGGGGWIVSGGCSLVAEHWQLKLKAMGLIPESAIISLSCSKGLQTVVNAGRI